MNQCSSSASSGQGGQQDVADLRGIGRGGMARSSQQAAAKVSEGHRNREKPVHPGVAEVAGKVGEGSRQEFGVDARDAEEKVQLGRSAGEEEDREGVKAEGVGGSPSRVGQQGKGCDQRGLMPGMVSVAWQSGPSRVASGVAGAVFGPVMTPDRNASSIQPQRARADRKAA